MLRIRKKQIDTFDKSAQADFHQRLLAFLRAELPKETAAMEDAALLERIVDGERRASAYGIESDAGIAQFVCLTFMAGPAFDEIPEVRAYLQEPGMEPEDKLAELVDYLTALENEGSLE
jgi:hypothetical protein